jgi:NitT/TauT family transport system substrate-binding protein
MTWTRRRLLGAAVMSVAGLGARRTVSAQALRPVTIAHAVSAFVYGQHLVARELGLFEDEGLGVPGFVVPGGGARVVNSLTAGQATFALGDASHPLKAAGTGRDVRMIFATDTRCSYANIVVRRGLYDRGVRSVEALADATRVGRKAIVAATAIGSGTYVYGVHVLKHTRAADGGSVNDHVEWAGGGASQTMLGGLRAGKFDAIMAVPEWQWTAEGEGFGKGIFDVLDEKAWDRVFGGPMAVTVGYVLGETIERSPDLVQAYVNAVYRAQQWIRRAKADEIVDLIHRPYLGAFTREHVLRSVRYYRTIFDWDLSIGEADYDTGLKVWVPTAVEKTRPYAQAVDMSFVGKARAKYPA